MSIWSELGFTGNPFFQLPLESNVRHRSLLIGRDRELDELKRRLSDDRLVLAIEGVNGVGKTSLALAAVFDQSQRDTSPVVSISDPYQLYEFDGSSFVDQALRDIARVAISLASGTHPGVSNDDLTITDEYNGLVEAYDSGRTLTALDNRRLLRPALNSLEERGVVSGLIGIIDNLEVEVDVEKTIDTIERARDTVLTLPLLRWLIIGTPGAVRAVTSSPRLQGHVSMPVSVAELDPQWMIDLVERRYALFSSEVSIRPIDAESFQWLYGAVGADLRSSLSCVTDFASATGSETLRRTPARNRRQLLEQWLFAEGLRIFETLDSTIPSEAWKFIQELGHQPGPSNPANSEWNANVAAELVVECLRLLEGHGLISRVVDERRPDELLVQLTKSGYIVFMHVSR